MRVLFRSRNHGQFNWQNISYEFLQIPATGEYVALQSDGPWYLVQLVIHTPFEQADHDAEVYAITVDHMDAKKRAWPDAPWRG